jgi:hypothetical protein
MVSEAGIGQARAQGFEDLANPWAQHMDTARDLNTIS